MLLHIAPKTIFRTTEDAVTQEKTVGANIIAEGIPFGTIADFNGNFKLNLPVGSYSIKVSTMGYRTHTQYNVVISSGNDQIIRYELHPDAASLGKVVITTNRRTTAVATHMFASMSVQRLTTQEIKASPRGNFDVSKVVKTLLAGGLSNRVGERNDIINYRRCTE
ncbi:carboxypeptidase-like regulatory domain-containing protein [Gelidibacter pelagius]|uniref:Carboxypeptidase-like regulatory domain-containing protein n=1 Tax=Gelidibacter pelagius TaxID=2819985 RepID=A0ABS3SVL0_9FLAO|nr:carboxypeptidase-like regulatory domain-containing protein [Gelidibacter pelagius]MBO3099731.1 carboxypeptidase-like regulatory domain-containing protein [Gelidibacter pelagius]